MSTPPLVPETRLNKNGVPVIKYVRAYDQEAASKNFMPAPAVGGRERNQSLFEKLVNSVLEFLLGPDSEDTEKESEARELLRARISELPDRTLKYAKDTWREMEQRADNGLDRTEFGHFSTKVRDDLKTFLSKDFGPDHPVEDMARDFENIVKVAKTQARKFKERAASRAAEQAPPIPTPPPASAFPEGKPPFGENPQGYQRYEYSPREQEPEFVHEGTIHDPRVYSDGVPPQPSYEPESATGVGALNNMLSGSNRRDPVDPMLGGTGG